MTAGGREAIESCRREAIHPAVSDVSVMGFFAVQRKARPGLGSMRVRAHLVGNPVFLQAVPGEPGVGALDRALDMIGGSREVIGRSHQMV
jgi:hypothetical protein